MKKKKEKEKRKRKLKKEVKKGKDGRKFLILDPAKGSFERTKAEKFS